MAVSVDTGNLSPAVATLAWGINSPYQPHPPVFSAGYNFYYPYKNRQILLYDPYKNRQIIFYCIIFVFLGYYCMFGCYPVANHKLKLKTFNTTKILAGFPGQ